MFTLISERTDFDTLLTDIKQDNFVHPLISCIKSKLDKFFVKMVNSSYCVQKQVIYTEKSSKRTTIEYAFDSDMPEFMQPVLNALSRVDSFILATTNTDCYTLFDVITAIIHNARHRGVFTLNKDETESSHPTVTWIKKLVEMIYTETRDKNNNKAEDFLATFEYSASQSEDDEVDIPKPKIKKKMPPSLKKKIMDDYNAKVAAAKAAKASEASSSRVIKTTRDLFLNAFKNNDPYSYPYLFRYTKDKQIDETTVHTCLNERKHPVIFETVLNWAMDHPKESENEITDDIYMLTNETNFNHHSLIPGLDIKQFYIDLHNSCLEHQAISVEQLRMWHFIKAFDKHFESIDKSKHLEFVRCAFRGALSATGKGFQICIEDLLNILVRHKICLNLTHDREIISYLKETFKKLISELNFEYVIILQNILLKKLKGAHKAIVEDRYKEERKQTNDEGEEYYEDYGFDTPKDRAADMLINLLISLTCFDHYQQIDFDRNPTKILEMMNGFMKLGGYVYVNIGFSQSVSDENKEQRAQINRITKTLDEFKEARAKHNCMFTFLHFLSTFNHYNDYSYSLIDENTPLSWIIDIKNNMELNMFEYSIDKDNVDVAMKLIEKCEISDVISSFPLQKKTFKNLLNSKHIMTFLTCVSENRSKIEELVLSNKHEAYLLSLPNLFAGVESHIQGKKMSSSEDKAHQLSSDPDYEDEECGDIISQSGSREIVYAFYLREHVIPKLGNGIEHFNLLFYYQGRYVLDELVKVLKVAQIRELNSQGYAIGKVVSFNDLNSEKLITI